MSTKQTATFFSVNTKSNSNPDPATGKKTSLLILLEAAGIRIQKIPNPVNAHLCYVVTFCKGVHDTLSKVTFPAALFSMDARFVRKIV